MKPHLISFLVTTSLVLCRLNCTGSALRKTESAFCRIADDQTDERYADQHCPKCGNYRSLYIASDIVSRFLTEEFSACVVQFCGEHKHSLGRTTHNRTFEKMVIQVQRQAVYALKKLPNMTSQTTKARLPPHWLHLTRNTTQSGIVLYFFCDQLKFAKPDTNSHQFFVTVNGVCMCKRKNGSSVVGMSEPSSFTQRWIIYGVVIAIVVLFVVCAPIYFCWDTRDDRNVYVRIHNQVEGEANGPGPNPGEGTPGRGAEQGNDSTDSSASSSSYHTAPDGE